MRFGKKSRDLAAASRRFFGERAPSHEITPALAFDTLEPMEDEEATMTPPPQEESMVAGDPTQRLLTSLGRFQRQVTRAEEGAPQESWCDECMNQLITGIEIALDEDWSDVKEALTDTARVLQSYEDAGRADLCVGFLKDSYEILCLMVGDLIVGNVRSGVLKKWKERHERALDELADAGLTLVDDESAGELDVSSGAAESDRANEQPAAARNGAHAAHAWEPEARVVSEESVSFDGDPFAPIDEMAQAAGDESPFERTNGGAFPVEHNASADNVFEPAEHTGSNDLILELSDDFTADSEEDVAAVADEPREEAMAAEESPDASADAVDDVEEDTGAFDFGEAEAEQPTPQADEPAREESWSGESKREPAGVSVFDSDEPESAPLPEPEAAAPASEPEPAPGTPEALFRTAQQAMAQGKVGDAKVFALQLAANMAKLEADQVQARMALIESDIESNDSAIRAAELSVSEAEGRVHQLEEQVAQSQQEFEEKRKQVDTIRQEVAAAEATVSDIERQIAELEARRVEEVALLHACQTNLDDGLNEDSRLQSEIESLAEEESGSRENLEGARERVKALQGTGSTHAAALSAARAELEQRLRAVADIERTIRQVNGEPDEPVGPEETLAAPEQALLEGGELGDDAGSESGE